MDEFRFVMRCFGFAALFLVLTQIKAGNMTIENHIESSLVNSNVSDFVNNVAAGGVKLIKDGYAYSIEYYRDWKRSENSPPEKVVNENIKEILKPESAVPDSSHAKTELSDEDGAELSDLE